MGAGDFHGRVRDGIGCGLPAITTRSSSPSSCPGSVAEGPFAKRQLSLISSQWSDGRPERVTPSELGVGVLVPVRGLLGPGGLWCVLRLPPAACWRGGRRRMISMHGVDNELYRAIRTG